MVNHDVIEIKNNQEHNKQERFIQSGTHCKDTIPKFETYIPGKELRDLSPNFHIHVSVNDVYIPRIGPQIHIFPAAE